MTFRQADDVNSRWTVKELQLQIVDSRRFHIITPFRFVTDIARPSGDISSVMAPASAAVADRDPENSSSELADPDDSLSAGQSSILVPGWPLAAADVADHATKSCRACTDFASVPRVIRGILGTYGPQLAAALTHDELCHIVGVTEGRRNKRERRDFADDVFLRAMRADGQPDRISAYQARLFWGGVSIVRYFKYRIPQAIALLIEILAGWITVLLALQVTLISFWGKSLRAVYGSHWYTEAWLWGLVFFGMLLVSGYFIGRSRENGAAWIFFWLSGVPGIYALCLWLPIPLTHRDTVPIFHWVIDYSAVGPCVILLAVAAAIVVAGALLRRRADWSLGIIAISALPWALPVAILTFIAQHALQIPDASVEAKPAA
jgi:hypothetical protein